MPIPVMVSTERNQVLWNICTAFADGYFVMDFDKSGLVTSCAIRRYVSASSAVSHIHLM